MQTTNKRRTDAQPAHYPKRNWWHRLIHEIKRRFEQRHAKKDKEPPADKAARITARATRIIALFTIVLAVATSLTLYEIHASGTLDQRAWIGMESVASEPSPPQIGKKWTFHVTFRNSGKTPALNMTHATKEEGLSQIPNVNLKCKEAIDKAAASTLVPPNGIFDIQIPVAGGMNIPSNWVQQSNEKGAFYVWGCMIYDDIFKRRHWLTYCATYRPVGADDPISFVACKSYNDTGDGDGPEKQ